VIKLFIVFHIVAPVVVAQPMNYTVDELTMIWLECRFSGDPIPQVTWHSSTGTISGMVTTENVEENNEVMHTIPGIG